MDAIISLKKLRAEQKLEQVMIRLPTTAREKAKACAAAQSQNGEHVTETDVYRTAVLLFLAKISTDSRAKDETEFRGASSTT